VETELVSDFRHRHGVGQILLVGEHQQSGIAKLILAQHLLELLVGLADTITIVGIDDEDQALSVLEVVAPQRTDLVLTSDVPHCKVDVLVLDCFDVETDRWDGGDDFTELQLVQDLDASNDNHRARTHTHTHTHHKFVATNPTIKKLLLLNYKCIMLGCD
jgi:hypothetical protein